MCVWENEFEHCIIQHVCVVFSVWSVIQKCVYFLLFSMYNVNVLPVCMCVCVCQQCVLCILLFPLLLTCLLSLTHTAQPHTLSLPVCRWVCVRVCVCCSATAAKSECDDVLSMSLSPSARGRTGSASRNRFQKHELRCWDCVPCQWTQMARRRSSVSSRQHGVLSVRRQRTVMSGVPHMPCRYTHSPHSSFCMLFSHTHVPLSTTTSRRLACIHLKMDSARSETDMHTQRTLTLHIHVGHEQDTYNKWQFDQI